MPNNDEQIRNLKNSRHIAGRLAELGELTQKEGSDGHMFIRFDGKIQYGDEDYEVASFQVYIREKTRDGQDSKQYSEALAWYKSAIPMTKDKENCTWVDLSGSVTQNLFVDNSGKLVESYRNSMRFFKTFSKAANELDIEGYIAGVSEGEDGKVKMGFLSRDMFGNCLKWNPLMVAPEIAEDLDAAGYEKGRTAELHIVWVPDKTESKPKRKSFGIVRSVPDRIRMIPTVVGGYPALDEDDEDALTRAQMKNLSEIYEQQKRDIIAKHEEDQKNGGHSKATSTKSTGKVSSAEKSKKFTELDDDDELPF